VSKKNEIPQSALRFLNLMLAVHSLPSMPDLDGIEEKILNALALQWGKGAKVTVMEMLQFFTNTSPSTVHRRLKSLKKKGMLALKEDEDDNRTKYILPTQLAIEYFEEIGKCMTMAARKT
jgi:DNA-binding MarR family transcriptional regulator